ncbi:MAG: hypothetical protein J6T23_01885 [Elusimicrobia bacterium]|nr:hypothetical protein [Elusimicrobiota bacterium]
MKKFFSLLAVFALVSMAGTAFAAPTAEGDPKTALATFTGGSISFSADLYTWNSTYTGGTATNITWNTTGIELGSSTEQFKCADVYALIQSTITAASGKVWVYQDNQNNSDTRFKVADDKPRHDGTETLFSGLVRGNSGGGDGDGNFAPLAAFYKPLSEAKTGIKTLPTQFPPSGEGSYGVYWFKDVHDSNYTPKESYTLVATSAGNFVGFGAPDFVKEPVVMFFGAKFKNVLGGDTYGTNSITFVSEIE